MRPMHTKKNLFSYCANFCSICIFQIVSNLPMATSLEVTFAAYLAVLLGTLLPTLFLIVLYLNSEARKIGDFTEEGTFSD